MKKFTLAVALLLASACLPTEPSDPSITVQAPVVVGGPPVTILAPYSTTVVAPGDFVRIDLDPAKLTKDHAAMAPYVAFSYDPLRLVKLNDTTYRVKDGEGVTGIAVCGKHCGDLAPMPIWFTVDVK